MKKFLRILFVILLGIGIVWLTIFLWPTEAKEIPFNQQAEAKKSDGSPLVIAHRGGAGIAPEGTMAAFDKSLEIGADILEYDLHLTSDGEVVVIHDPTVDRTTDGSGKVNDMTLEEVQNLDAGYTFQDEDGSYPYRDQGVTIPTLKEMFEAYPDELHLIEIKDSNDPELYDEIIDETWNIIDEYGMHDNVTVASFDHEIIEEFREVSDNQVALGAGESEATKFTILSMLRLDGLAQTGSSQFQLPMSQLGIDLTSDSLRTVANDQGVHVYYWTINETEDMQTLIDKDVDGIMTDYPDELVELIQGE